MSQKPRAAAAPSRVTTDVLINGDSRAGEERLIGGDTGLAAVMTRARIVSRSAAPVLLFGETGTGKEIIARAIHEHSPFRNGPFRRVNCGAIPSELIDSELFGHEQGAFTGAVTRRKGWFEQADGGTLFLDEVGELALAAQVRLLRVVQDSEVVRVGGERPVRVNVRIVAATHRDLPGMVEKQTFREDLYYRLSVFPIVIPPLRDRPADIRAFANYFAERAANRFGLRPVPVSDEDVQRLAEYQWPGNVREMAAVMDRAVLIGQGRTLNVAAALGQGAMTAGPSPSRSPDAPARRIAPLDDVIRQHIEDALEATSGRVEGPHGAARLLRINPHTLRARMRKLRIDWRSFRTAGAPEDRATDEEIATR
jgi:hydrogenase-4 transcriptional activator